jgi:hypothetical protein
LIRPAIAALDPGLNLKARAFPLASNTRIEDAWEKGSNGSKALVVTIDTERQLALRYLDNTSPNMLILGDSRLNTLAKKKSTNP